MKKSFRFFLIAILIVAIFIVPKKGHFSELWRGEQAMIFPTIEEAIKHAKASNHVSQKYKTPNGSWVLPFELYQQVLIRSGSGGQIRDYYEARPVMVDVNGDGLLDVVKSIFSPATSTQGPGYIVSSGASLEQYILLRAPGGGYTSVFTCSLTSATSYYQFQGDCADTSFPFDPNYQAVIPGSSHKPPTFFPYDNTQWVRSAGNTYAGVDRAYYDCPNTWSGHSRGDCDRPMAKLIDLNGDGLVDVTFVGSHQRYEDRGGGYYDWISRSISYTLFNTGSGFVP